MAAYAPSSTDSSSDSESVIDDEAVMRTLMLPNISPAATTQQATWGHQQHTSGCSSRAAGRSAPNRTDHGDSCRDADSSCNGLPPLVDACAVGSEHKKGRGKYSREGGRGCRS
eukprot:6206277-Pleurochrysis_carterae.AAC.1